MNKKEQMKYSDIPEKEIGKAIKESIRRANKEQKELMNKKEQWEKDFDKEFGRWGFLPKGLSGWKRVDGRPKDYVKKFISTLLQKEKEETKRQVGEEINKRLTRKRHTNICRMKSRQDTYCTCGAYEYNKAVKVKDKYLKELGVKINQ